MTDPFSDPSCILPAFPVRPDTILCSLGFTQLRSEGSHSCTNKCNNLRKGFFRTGTAATAQGDWSNCICHRGIKSRKELWLENRPQGLPPGVPWSTSQCPTVCLPVSHGLPPGGPRSTSLLVAHSLPPSGSLLPVKHYPCKILQPHNTEPSLGTMCSET